MSPKTNIILCFFSIFIFIFHTTATARPAPTPTATPTPKEIHNLLPDYGFPKGIFPNNIALYTISPSGYFTVHLDCPCYARNAGRLFYYHTLITGTLTNGSISAVSGMQTKMLFIWLSVHKMEIDSGMLEFYIGAFSKKLPADEFQNVPECSANAG